MAKRRQKGTGSVWQDPNTKKWKGQIQVGYLKNGNKKIKTVSGTTQREVNQKLEKIKAEYLTDSYIDCSNITIPELAKQINDEKKALNLIKTGTFNRNVQTIKILEKGGLQNYPVQKLTEQLLRNFYAANCKDYSTSVIKKMYETINASYKRAIQLGIVKANINSNIPRPKSTKITKKVNALTLQKQKEVVQALNEDKKEPYRTMLLLSLYTGMRMGEVCALPLYNINFDENTITVDRTTTRDERDSFVVGKSAKTEAGHRTIKVLPLVTDLLHKYINSQQEIDKDLIFKFNDKLTNPTQVNSYYKRLITRYKIDESADGYNQHQLRHTYATRSIESGMSAKVLQKKLGHTDIKVTMNTYADVFAKFEDTEDEKLNAYLAAENLL